MAMRIHCFFPSFFCCWVNFLKQTLSELTKNTKNTSSLIWVRTRLKKNLTIYKRDRQKVSGRTYYLITHEVRGEDSGTNLIVLGVLFEDIV